MSHLTAFLLISLYISVVFYPCVLLFVVCVVVCIVIVAALVKLIIGWLCGL